MILCAYKKISQKMPVAVVFATATPLLCCQTREGNAVFTAFLCSDSCVFRRNKWQTRVLSYFYKILKWVFGGDLYHIYPYLRKNPSGGGCVYNVNLALILYACKLQKMLQFPESVI
jgi:hypothetical protein